MSAFDITVLQYLMAYGLPVISVVSLILCVTKHFSTMRNKLLSRLVSNFDTSYERIMVVHKKNLFLPLHDVVSSDWKLKNKGLIRIVEIGFRTG